MHSVCVCPIDKLIAVHKNGTAFDVELILYDGIRSKKTIDQDSFPYNWDNYHFKIAILAQRYLNGDHLIIY